MVHLLHPALEHTQTASKFLNTEGSYKAYTEGGTRFLSKTLARLHSVITYKITIYTDNAVKTSDIIS
jgi:hypothetical protein